VKGLTVVRHPVLEDRLASLRDRRTPPAVFRRCMAEAGALLGVEALKGARQQRTTVRTPLRAAPARRLGQPVVFVGILRAGLGLVEGLSRVLPEAATGHIGMYRNEDTLNPVRYYVKLPPLAGALTLLADPMLATGGSAVEALEILKTEGARRIVLVSLVSSREGVRRVRRQHPDVPIVTAAVDPTLNRVGYIVPGLGDAGDRLFGT
jgi:uracil phosphoribosyltransferase